MTEPVQVETTDIFIIRAEDLDDLIFFEGESYISEK